MSGELRGSGANVELRHRAATARQYLHSRRILHAVTGLANNLKEDFLFPNRNANPGAGYRGGTPDAMFAVTLVEPAPTPVTMPFETVKTDVLPEYHVAEDV